MPEPIEEWTDLNNINPLKAMYTNPGKYEAVFQILTINSHVRMFKRARNMTHNVITERCWESNKDIFTKMAIRSGYIDRIQNEMYEHILYDRLSEIPNPKPDAYIYLRTSVDNCMKRIKARDRNGENCITRKYLQTIQRYQEAFLDKYREQTIVNDNNVTAIDDYESMVGYVVCELTKMKPSRSVVRGSNHRATEAVIIKRVGGGI